MYRSIVITNMATAVFTCGLTLSLILLIICSWYRTKDLHTHKTLLYIEMSMFIATIVTTIVVAICFPKPHYMRAENSVDTTSVKYHLLKTCDEQIAKQLKYEKLYNEQRPQSCYADAIDYTDLYAIKEMIESTYNCDSLWLLNKQMYSVVNRLDNYTNELFKREGIHE